MGALQVPGDPDGTAVVGPRTWKIFSSTFDKRTFYLRDLTLIGCTAWDEPMFPALVARIARVEPRPLVAKTFPLERIADAQLALLEKGHVGNFVLIPPPPGS